METEEQVVEGFEYSEEEYALGNVQLTLYLGNFMMLMVCLLIYLLHKGLILFSSQYSTYLVKKGRVGYSVFTE